MDRTIAFCLGFILAAVLGLFGLYMVQDHYSASMDALSAAVGRAEAVVVAAGR